MSDESPTKPTRERQRVRRSADATTPPALDKKHQAVRDNRTAKHGQLSPPSNLGLGVNLQEGRRLVAKIDLTPNKSDDEKTLTRLAREFSPEELKKSSNNTTRSVGRPSSAAKKTAASLDFSNVMGAYNISPEFDRYDMLDLAALHLIELLQQRVYNFANLSKYERKILYRYFYRTNPVIGRIIDLHTDLPLSRIRLQAPKNQPEIVRDYIMQFYERIFDRLKLDEIVREAVLTFWIYGEANILVDDYYEDHPRVLEPLTILEERTYKHNQEDLKFLQEIENRYKRDPATVSLAERLQYVEKKFSSFFDSKYNGPDRLRVLHFFSILETLENKDIDFEAVRYQLSESFQQLRNDRATVGDLYRLGYSKGMLSLLNSEGADSKSVIIDNDSYSGLPFIFTLKSPDDSSLIQRVMQQAIEWDIAKQATKAKIETLGKLGRIVTAKDASPDQVDALRAEVEMMMGDPNHAIVTNYEIAWEEVNSFIKEELRELIDRTKDIIDEISLGGGMPLSLITGEAQYSGSTVSLEVLNTYYLSFNQNVRNLLEERLFKPIALRKGFVTIDSWGNPELVYPKVTFSRIGIRDQGTYDILFSLYQKGSLPISIILDILNLDADDVRRGVEQDLWTINDPNMNDLIRDILGNAAGDIYADSDVKTRLLAALRLKLTSSDPPDSEQNTDNPLGKDLKG